MNWKAIVIGVILLAAGVAAFAFYKKVVQPSEGYRTEGNSYYYTFEPHQTFGCSRYIAPDSLPKNEMAK